MKKTVNRTVGARERVSFARRERGITLVALIITIIVLIILSAVTIFAFTKSGLLQTASKGTENYANAQEYEQKVMNDIDKHAQNIVNNITEGGNGEAPEEPENPPIEPEEPEEVNFSTAYGRIDVIWLAGKTNTPSANQKPNAPVLTSNGESMTPVKWEGNTPVLTNENDSEWYEYREAEGIEDSKNSYWANARTVNSNVADSDQSYFVWIPRYAYRITYYENETSTEPTGYYDGYGMWRAGDRKLKYKLEEGVETITYNGNKYIVHPAFTTAVDMGGWSENLSGFWFAKFEMSGNGNNAIKSIPGARGTDYQSLGTFYTWARTATYGFTGMEDETAKGGDGNKSYMNSHLVKNSEWGAVAYLTLSKYGRNGHEITKNTTYYTGGGTGNAYITSSSNAEQSTTGNVYGVYDMSGGVMEYIAVWDTKSTYNMGFGSPFTSTNGVSTKYATAYNNESAVCSGSPLVYEVGKTGDGIKEVWSANDLGWFGKSCYLPGTQNPFLLRSGNTEYTGRTDDGVLFSSCTRGAEKTRWGFRVVLCP